jgi:hypothetical protein
MHEILEEQIKKSPRMTTRMEKQNGARMRKWKNS